MGIQLVKFGVNANWEPVKYNVSVEMPERMSLEALRGGPHPQPGETLMPEESRELPPLNETYVSGLKEMGFGDNAVRRALYATLNKDMEAALNWLMEHMGDADVNDPLPDAAAKSSSTA